MSPRRIALLLCLLLLGGYAAICALLYSRQDALLYFPVPATPANTADATPLEGVGVGETVLVSRRRVPGKAALLYFGGNAEDVAASLPAIAAAFPDRALYALHYRGYAGSGGTPSEPALVGDATALYDQVAKNHPRIVVVGRSLGSGIAVQLAARRPVERLVLVTPFDSIAAVGQAHYPWLPVRWLVRDRYDSAAVAARVRAPVRVLTAGADRVIPRERTRALVAAFRSGQVDERVFAVAGHDDISASPGYTAALARP